MRLLLRNDTGEFKFTEDLIGDDTIPPYAILSHKWGADMEEVTFEDVENGAGKDKPGYEKIRFCGEQARKDHLQYFWIDTCCIKKSNFTELSQAINSMFRWYRDASRCYVYLPDVSKAAFSSEEISLLPWESDFRKSRWFERGWTLQELLAPSSVEFFSREGQRLGDKRSLEHQIHEITGIADLALHGAPLSQFSVEERFSWIERRQTKLEEDMAYSLLGIFDVSMPLIYGEGSGKAFKRLREEIDKPLNGLLQQRVLFQMENEDRECIQHLRLTDPRDDKIRIEDTKGGLLDGSCHWILENSDFQQWRNDRQSRLLWVKGDPGKGKTMLLCGIVNELKKSIAKTDLLSYFFCQATDSRINNATAVLRGLLYLLVDQQPSLISHIRRKHDHAGKSLFEDANAWVALSEIFTDILQDPSLDSTYLIIDALDECVVDLPKLLDFVVQKSFASPYVKWIVSSRNWPNIEEQLEKAEYKVRLCLELNAESVSTAVSIYIQYKVLQLAQRKKYDEKTRDAVLDHLFSNATNTFLWVALVCQNLEKITRWNTLAKLNAFPPGLESLYKRMVEYIRNSDDADLCKQILASTAIVYRPITLKELTSLIEVLKDMSDSLESLGEIISLCGSFLTIREGTIYFVHQSAKDYLVEHASSELFPNGRIEVQQRIVARSIEAMDKVLQKDVYGLRHPGCSIDKVENPDPNPLAPVRYACIYWVDHLCEIQSSYDQVGLYDNGTIDVFLRKHFLHWLEALSLIRGISDGILAVSKLIGLLTKISSESHLFRLIQDTRRFILSTRNVIENAPLQAYSSALLFSPVHSLTRELFQDEEPDWVTTKPAMEADWGSCMQTLYGHSGRVNSVAFSYDGTKVVSGSFDETAKIWDTSSGACLNTLDGHSNWVNSVTFSYDGTKIVSGSEDRTVKIWDTGSGTCLKTLNGHSSWVTSVAFSYDDTKVVSGSYDRTVKIWDTSSGAYLKTLEGHSSRVNSVTFSYDGTKVVSGSEDKTVKIWDTGSGTCLKTLDGHSSWVSSVAFSYDGTKIVSGSEDKTVKIWDTSSGACIKTLEGHSKWVSSVAFSYDGRNVVSGSADKTVKIWDNGGGAYLKTLEGHSNWVSSVAFSHDGTKIVSGSYDKTVRIWDTGGGGGLKTLEGHSNWVNSATFSHDGTKVVSGSEDRTVKIWDTGSGAYLKTLEGHSKWVSSVAFSYDGRNVVSGSADKTVKIWDNGGGAYLKTLEGHSNWVSSVAFSHDGTKIVSGSEDKTVKIWDTGSGADLKTLEGHSSRVNSVAFSYDGTKVVSGSEDKTVKIWDTGGGVYLNTLNVGRSIDNVAFDTTDSYLLSDTGTISLNISSNSNVALTTTALEEPRYHGYGLDANREWITWNGQNVLWLPSEYRPSYSAVESSTVVIGCSSGRVLIFNFSLSKSPLK